MTPVEPSPSGDPPLVRVDLRRDGLLWLINRQLFHPRGFALAVEGRRIAGVEAVTGFLLLGDGTEPWTFDGDEDAIFAAAEAAFDRARQHNRSAVTTA